MGSGTEESVERQSIAGQKKGSGRCKKCNQGHTAQEGKAGGGRIRDERIGRLLKKRLSIKAVGKKDSIKTRVYL